MNQKEKEFLKNYDITKYPRPSVTVDVAMFSILSQDVENYRKNDASKLSLLLIKRGGYPDKGKWALPGGFLQEDETIEEGAYRETKEETNMEPSSLMPIATFSDVNRDKRGRIISNAFASIIVEDENLIKSGDDADDAQWFRVTFDKLNDNEYLLNLISEETILSSTLKLINNKFGLSTFEIIESNLAFDHAKIIATAICKLKTEVKNFNILFDFLPDKFTLTKVQSVQEAILNEFTSPANFRRKISPYVEETNEFITGKGHRPAKLFKRR